MSKTTEELVKAYRQIKDELEALKMIPESQLAAIKDEIKLRLEEGEESYSDDLGYARLNKGRVTVKYDKKALDKLQEDDPLGAYEFLMVYRSEKTGKPTISIK